MGVQALKLCCTDRLRRRSRVQTLDSRECPTSAAHTPLKETDVQKRSCHSPNIV